MTVRTVLKMVILGAMVFTINMGVASAAIVGAMGLTGSYSTSGGAGQSDNTTLSFGDVKGTDLTDGGLGVTFGVFGVINDGSFSFVPFNGADNIFTIGGWTLNLTSLNIDVQSADVLTLYGAGVLSGNGESTAATWEFSGNTSGDSYSMTVTAVPVPAAIWLFGSGLIGLVGIARKKA